jgi:hypothetical protein
VHGKRHKAYVIRGIESLHGFHESDIAFLDEVIQGQAVTRIALGDMDNETQVRHDELARCVEVFFIAETRSKYLFVFFGQNRDAADGLDVGVETAYRACQRKFVIAYR